MNGKEIEFQRDVDAVDAARYDAFFRAGPGMSAEDAAAAHGERPALRRYDEALEKVAAEAGAAAVAPGSPPAAWLVYNAGLVVKTPRSLFALDLSHRRGATLAPALDFALVTHNHADHMSPGLAEAMDRDGKTVVSNFMANYGAHRGGKRPGGYARGEKTLALFDVSVRCTPSDHNGYLVDFTTAFEIDFGGFTIYHTGDSSNLAKLSPTRPPDLWVVHPRCGLDVAEGVAKFRPRRVAIVHLCEMGHSQWRWTLADGHEEAGRVRAAGAEAFVPLWGERIL